jgi:hypothetical protein
MIFSVSEKHSTVYASHTSLIHLLVVGHLGAPGAQLGYCEQCWVGTGVQVRLLPAGSGSFRDVPRGGRADSLTQEMAVFIFSISSNENQFSDRLHLNARSA